MKLSSILEQLNLRFLDIDTEEAYISLQRVLQRKLLVKIRMGLIVMLLASFIYSICGGHTAEEILLKAVLPTTMVFAGMFRDKFNNLNNGIFIIIYWIIGYLLPPRMLEFYEKENRIAMFFVGYFMGIVEVVVAFSIKDNFYRLLLQVMLVFGKLFNFFKYLSQEPIINVTLWTISFISIVFFFYHDGLDRLNFKTTHDVTKKLQKFQSYLADDFPVSVIMISAEVNSLIYSNLAFKHTFGDPYSAPNPERFIRETFRKLIIQLNAMKTIEQEKEPRQSLFHYIQSLNNSQPANKENEVFNVYVTHKKEDEDTEIHFEIKLKRITWENHPAFTIILNDVSDKQQILALKTADEQKDRVVATISHELKTPINGILGLLEIVSSQDQNETSRKYLEHCKSCSKLLLYFVNSVLDLSQLRKNQLQIEKSSFSLQALLEEIKSLYIFTSEHKGLDFIIEKGPLAPETIYTDRYRLAEVLMSLLSNAMKFTFAGHVKVRVTPEFAVFPRLVFYVEDSGVGIKEKEKRDLFQMFGKLPEADKNINLSGAGLGLSIANQLVKALNKRKSDAQISFESQPGEGSKFWFPVDISPDLGSSTGINEIQDQRPQQRLINSSVLGNSQEALSRNVLEHRVGFNVTSSRTSSLGTGAQDQQLRVLIVDDNPFNLIAASHITKRIGFAPETADTGKECLQILEESRRNEQPFDLVLMDIQMPIMDGIETTQIINDKIKKGKLYYVPVVALTAKHVDLKERSNNLKSGLFDTLEKPLVESELRRVMRNIQENALSRNTTV